jgi:hypothetical protein
MADKRPDRDDELRRRESGGSYGANEEEQTKDRERAAEGKDNEDTDDMITDAEMEVREANRSERGDR